MMEIYALTIENIIETSLESREEIQENIIKSLFSNLVKGIETKNEDIKGACLSIATRLFKCFGQLILRSSANLLNKD
jgi:chorismate mutase